LDPRYDFDRKISLNLQRDEAVVLLWYLTRELWGGERLTATCQHPSEPHALEALLQELIPPLLDTGDPKHADAIHAAARDHLLQRFT
jgi:hypothetical protein